MCLAFSTTVNDAAHGSNSPALALKQDWCPFRLPPWPIPFPPPQQGDTAPGNPPANPPRGPAGPGPAAAHRKQQKARARRSPHPPELSHSPGSPKASPPSRGGKSPRHLRGEPRRVPRTPAPSAQGRIPPISGPLSTPHTPEPAQLEPSDRHPPHTGVPEDAPPGRAPELLLHG